jgi:outer membrane receptor protein involved in Fe transport
VYDPSYIECTTNCPTSTAKNRTINDNDIAGSFYLDFSANYSFMVGPAQAEAFFAVKNLANRDPVLVGNGPTGNNTDAYPQTVRTLYDVFGRTFRLGVRMSFQ